MRKLIAIILLIASCSQAADVVLGKWSDITWVGSGNDKVASFAVAPSNPTDPNTYVGLWRLHSTNSAGNYPDASGNGFTGTNSGTIFTTNAYTNAFGQSYGKIYFDGIDDTVFVGDYDLLSMTNGAGGDIPFTIGLWFKFKTFNASTADMFMQKGEQDASSDEFQFYHLGGLSLALHDSTAVNRNKNVLFSSLFGMAPTDTNKWWFLCASYGGKTNANLYMNVSPDSTNTPLSLGTVNITTTVTSYVSMGNRSGNLRIAQAGTSTSYSFNGEMHHVFMIRGTNITQAQAQYIMTNTIPTNYLFTVSP